MVSDPIHSVHPGLWERLAKGDPREVCKRSGARYDEVAGGYLLDFLKERYLISPSSSCVKGAEGTTAIPSVDLQVVLITYLLRARAIPLAQRLVAASGLKGGARFFQGAHRLPLDPLVVRYGEAPERFIEKGLSLGGIVERYGDAAIRLQALPRVPVILVLWRGDNEFPPRLSCLFDASIEHQLPLDAVYGLVGEICHRMSA